MRAATATTLLASLALLLASGPGLARNPDLPRPGGGPFVVDPAATLPPYQVLGRAVEITTRAVRVRVEPLDDAARGVYFRTRTRVGRDPFPQRSEFIKGYTVFAVSIQNGAATDVTYTPALTTCRDDKDRDVRQLQLDDLIDVCRHAFGREPDSDKVSMRALDAMHARPLTIRPGQMATKLLVLEGTEANARGLAILLDTMQVGSEDLRLRFVFKAAHAAEGGAR